MLSVAGPLEVWVIRGTAGDDQIDIEFANEKCTKVVATLNGKEVGTRLASTIKGFSITCGNGDDNVFIALDDDNAIGATVDGGAGDDTIYSDWGDDSLIGGTGNDWLDGYYGADTLGGGAGADELHGDGGDDSLDGGGGDDTIYAGTGDDTAAGGAGDDDLYGNAGDDEVDGGAGNDDIWGNAGDDTLGGDGGSDDINGGDGSDELDGDAGIDELNGGAGNDTVGGDAGNDDIDGGTGSDDLSGDAGNDDVDGGAGNDDLSGGDGSDSLDGDAGRDSLDGDSGNDSLDGDAGNDSVNGDEGDDSIAGDTGNDTLSGGAGSDSVGGGDGNDELHGGTGDDVLTGGAGMDVIYRWAGDKVIGDKFDQWRNDFRDSPVQSLNDPAWIEQIRQALIDQVVQRYSYYLGQDTSAQTYEIRNENGELVYWNDVPWVNGEPSAARYYSYPCYSYPYYGQPFYRGYLFANDNINSVSTNVALTGSVATDTSSTSTTTTDYSTTNNQVQGVEEGDMVQTDGHYIYLLSGRNIQIIDASTADQTHEISSITLPNGVYGSALYIDGDRMTVVSTHYDSAPDRGEYGDLFGWYSYFGTTETTDVTVYDVADRTSPQMLSQTELDGYCNGSRDINGQIYLVTGNTLISPEPEYQITTQREEVATPGMVTTDTSNDNFVEVPAPSWDDMGCVSPDDPQPMRLISTYVVQVANHLPDGYGVFSATAHRTIESADAYRARLEALPVESFLPQSTTTDAAGQTVASGAVVGIDRLYAQSKPDLQASIFSVVKIDAIGEAAAPQDSLMIMGQSGQVYMTQKSLYIAASTYERVSNIDTSSTWSPWFSQWQVRTDIYKISLDADRLEFVAAGQVPGDLHDQFSMDEYDGRLRIVTTTGQWTGTSASHLFVLEPQGPTLEIVGVLTGMGIGESVYATRFVGDRAYVVTFKQTDPLHVIDLSDPTKPKLAGVLHIPGYSSYLQPVGDHLLLGIGRDATDTGRVTAIQLSLFDVSDSAHPKRVSQLKFDAGSSSAWASYSEALWDHKAFNYFPEQGILALPFGHYVTSSSENGCYYGSWESQLDLVRVDGVAGLSLAASVDVDSSISRTLRIGDNIYSVSDEGVRVAALSDPATVIAQVDRQWTDSTLVLSQLKTRWRNQYYVYYGNWYWNEFIQPIQTTFVFRATLGNELTVAE